MHLVYLIPQYVARNGFDWSIGSDWKKAEIHFYGALTKSGKEPVAYPFLVKA